MEGRNGGDVAPEKWGRLWEVVKPDDAPHAVDLATLGEYALLLRRRGATAATRIFPAVAMHLAAGCPRCSKDLRELTAFVDGELVQELASLGLGFQRGVLTPLAPQFRGRPSDSPDRSGVATEELVASFELFRRAVEEGDARARAAATTRIQPIVTTWLKRDPWWSGTDADAEKLAGRAFDQFWAATTPERFRGFHDFLDLLRALRETARIVPREGKE
jgi:hypothetical protein